MNCSRREGVLPNELLPCDPHPGDHRFGFRRLENGFARLRHSLVDESDILHAARELQGVERLEQIKYAVLERNGGITIIPNVAEQ